MQNTIADDPRCPVCGAGYIGPTPFPSEKDEEAACVNCGHAAPSEAWFAVPAVEDTECLPPVSEV